MFFEMSKDTIRIHIIHTAGFQQAAESLPSMQLRRITCHHALFKFTVWWVYLSRRASLVPSTRFTNWQLNLISQTACIGSYPIYTSLSAFAAVYVGSPFF